MRKQEERGSNLAQGHTAGKLKSRFESGTVGPESVLLDTKLAASLHVEMNYCRETKTIL